MRVYLCSSFEFPRIMKIIQNQPNPKILKNGGSKSEDVSRETLISAKKCRTVDVFCKEQFRARRPSYYEKTLILRQSQECVLRIHRAGAIKIDLQNTFRSRLGLRDPIQHAKICTAPWREFNFDPQVLKNHFFSMFLCLHPNSSQTPSSRGELVKLTFLSKTIVSSARERCLMYDFWGVSNGRD